LDSSDFISFSNKLDETLANSNIFVGSAGNIATSVLMSGDATLNNTGVLTISNNAITTSKILNGAVTNAKLANNSVTLNAGDGLSITSSVVTLGSSVTLDVDNTVVRTTGNQTIGGLKTFTDNIVLDATTGSVNLAVPPSVTSWTLTLPPDSGTSGYVLRTDGSGETSWVPQSGGPGSGITNLNGLTSGTQNFSVGVSGSSFNIISSGFTHTFNIPIATTGTTTGLVSNNSQTFGGSKTFNNTVFMPSLTAGVSSNAIGILGTGELVSAVSQRKYKIQEEPLSSEKAKELLMKLKPKFFTWSKSQERDLGLIVEDFSKSRARRKSDDDSLFYIDSETGSRVNYKDRALLALVIKLLQDQLQDLL
jgi:hypothetical protein